MDTDHIKKLSPNSYPFFERKEEEKRRRGEGEGDIGETLL